MEDEWQIAADIRDGRLSSFLIRPFDYMLVPTDALRQRPPDVHGGGRFCRRRRCCGYSAVTCACRTTGNLGADGLLPGAGRADPILRQLRAGHDRVLAARNFDHWSSSSTRLNISLSGRVFPLDLMPPYFRAVTEWLPFKYELYFRWRSFSSASTAPSWCAGSGFQMLWVVVAFATARMLWARGLRSTRRWGG